MSTKAESTYQTDFRSQSAIMSGNTPIPVLAFFGAKGGVGKTTISRTFAELITCGQGRNNVHPNVLAIDFDVDHRGLTTLVGNGVVYNFPTVHEIIALRNTQGADGVDISDTIKRPAEERGHLYLMPSAPKEAANIFKQIASIDPEELLSLITSMIQQVVSKYEISCVIIDCGPIVNPYTAAAAKLSTAAFIIGQNEPITYQSLNIQPARIKDFYPDFNSDKVKIIINKVRNFQKVMEHAQRMEIYFAIPFTIDVVDDSEGLISDIRKMRLMLFEKVIVDLIEKALRGRPDLVPKPEILLDKEWRGLLEKAPRMTRSKKMKTLALMRHLRWFGIALLLAGTLGLTMVGLGKLQSPDGLEIPGRETSVWADSAATTNSSILALLAGLAAIGAGIMSNKSHKRFAGAIRKLRDEEGVSWLFEQISSGPTSRRVIDDLKAIAATTPGKSDED